jgi:DNA polymerase sigma
VKFFNPETGIHCDLNVNDRLGAENTHLLRKYCKLLPQLTELVYLIKKWAKSHELNSPAMRGVTASFSSYALTLMTISKLQARIVGKLSHLAF